MSAINWDQVVNSRGDDQEAPPKFWRNEFFDSREAWKVRARALWLCGVRC
mgnify:CR=1 FL=1